MKAVKKVFVALSAILVWTAIPAASAHAVSIGQACAKTTLGTRVSIRVNKKPVIVVCRNVAGRKKWIRAAVQTITTTTTSTSTTSTTTTVPQPVINYTDIVDPIDPTFHTITIEGMQPRTYHLYAPTDSSADSSADSKLPLLLGFHGRTADAQFFRRQSSIDTYVFTEKFFAILINSSIDQWSSWNAGNCCSPSTQNNIDDVGLVSAIIDHTVNAYRIDQSRIWAIGHSNGGMMAYRLACDLSEKISGVAIVGGALMDDSCNPSKPVSILHIHGDNDETIPFTGGGKFDVPDIQSSVIKPNAKFSCDIASNEITPTVRVNQVAWNCERGAQTKLMNYLDNGHEWHLEYTKGILRFLFAHPRK